MALFLRPNSFHHLSHNSHHVEALNDIKPIPAIFVSVPQTPNRLMVELTFVVYQLQSQANQFSVALTLNRLVAIAAQSSEILPHLMPPAPARDVMQIRLARLLAAEKFAHPAIRMFRKVSIAGGLFGG
jgi:hypothetical protein